MMGGRSVVLGRGMDDMELDLLQRLLIGCALVHYGLLIVWVLLAVVARGPWLRLQQRLFDVPIETLRVLNYVGIAIYKLVIIVFFLVPGLVLHFLR